jgi:hypothetical protein
MITVKGQTRYGISGRIGYRVYLGYIAAGFVPGGNGFEKSGKKPGFPNAAITRRMFFTWKPNSSPTVDAPMMVPAIWRRRNCPYSFQWPALRIFWLR